MQQVFTGVLDAMETKLVLPERRVVALIALVVSLSPVALQIHAVLAVAVSQ